MSAVDDYVRLIEELGTRVPFTEPLSADDEDQLSKLDALWLAMSEQDRETADQRLYIRCHQ